jgi:uncharacterized protein (TIGR03435 family)
MAAGPAVLLASSPAPDAESGKLQFDVASVRKDRSERKPKSNVPLGPGAVFPPSGGVLSATNFNLISFLEFAYKLTDYQADEVRSKLPDWALRDKFTIEARTENHNVTKDQMRLMVQSLLAGRFKLAVHYQERVVAVSALVVAEPGTFGPMLRPHAPNASCPNYSPRATDAGGTPVPELPETGDGGFPTYCGSILGVPASAQDRYSFGARDVPMSFIANSFASWGHLGRPVVNQTGLDGTYDFVLDFTPDPRPKYATIDSGGPGFEEAMRKQLGLKLESRKAPVKFLVIDHIEEPTEN